MKVLVVRFSAIGDCVMTAWAVTALKNAVPDSRVIWAVQERCAAVVDTDRLVEKLQIFPRDAWKRHRWSPKTWREQYLRYTGLRKVGIDVGFDFQGHSKTALCLRMAGCKERFASRATDALAARLNPPMKLSPVGPHEVQQAIALVQERFDATLPELPMMPSLEHDRKEWGDGSNGTKLTVTIQTGAGEADKLYPVRHWDAVASRLVADGFRVVAIGAPSDPHLSSTEIEDEVGKHSLSSSLAVVATSQLHLAADTGTGHAAAAYGVPVVSIFGRTDPSRFRPWTLNGQVLREGTDPALVDPGVVYESAVALLKERNIARTH